jgi:hypothetical protein
VLSKIDIAELLAKKGGTRNRDSFTRVPSRDSELPLAGKPFFLRKLFAAGGTTPDGDDESNARICVSADV